MEPPLLERHILRGYDQVVVIYIDAGMPDSW